MEKSCDSAATTTSNYDHDHFIFHATTQSQTHLLSFNHHHHQIQNDHLDTNNIITTLLPAADSSAPEYHIKCTNSGVGWAQPQKKQCKGSYKKTTSTSKPAKSSDLSKDPQGIVAKQRRERISERLKILQDLVPNGSKVDLVSMLEKAINYVKFLQVQVKVLSADEFWPTQGGKPLHISQVKEAIDSILLISSNKRATCRLNSSNSDHH